MRLTERTLQAIRASVAESFGEVPVYLFGSRVDDRRRGGDIDLAIDVDCDRNEFRRRKIAFLGAMMRRGYDVGIDLVRYCPTDPLLRSEIAATARKLAG